MKAEVYGRPGCGYCGLALDILRAHDIEHVYHDIYNDPAALQAVKSVGASTVPQIWIDGKHIGGYRELREMKIQGKLEEK